MENTYKPIQDYLASQGQSFSQENVNKLAAEKGMTNFTSTDANNRQLASLLSTPVAPVVPVKEITSNTLNAQPINIPTAPVTQTVTQPVNMVDQILNSTQETEAQRKARELSTGIVNLLPNLQGESATLAREQELAGVNKFRKELQDLNSQITIKSAELNQDDIKLAQGLQTIEDKPIAMEFIAGEQSSLQRNAQIARALKTAEIGVLNARAVATQGNVALAMDLAQNAVDQKYAPIKEAMNLYKSQLEALAPILAADEKKASQAMSMKWDMAMNDLKERQANESKVQELIVNAAGQGASQAMLTAASKAKTPQEAASLLGVYAGDYRKARLLEEQIRTERAQQSNYFANIAKTRAEMGASVNALSSVGNIKTAEDLQRVTSTLTLNEGQGKAVAFAQRAINADKALRERLNTYDPTTIFSSAGRLLETDNARGFQRDLTDFITAVLRKESGATISPEEFATFIPLYSPQGITTNKQDIEQTNQKRTTAIDALIAEAGKAAPALSSYKMNNQVNFTGTIENNKENTNVFKNTVDSMFNLFTKTNSTPTDDIYSGYINSIK